MLVMMSEKGTPKELVWYQDLKLARDESRLELQLSDGKSVELKVDNSSQLEHFISELENAI